MLPGQTMPRTSPPPARLAFGCLQHSGTDRRVGRGPKARNTSNAREGAHGRDACCHGASHPRPSLPGRVGSAQRGEQSTPASCTPSLHPVHHRPGALCRSSHLLPQTLRPGAPVPVGGVPAAALGTALACVYTSLPPGRHPATAGDRAGNPPDSPQSGPPPWSGNF